MSGLNNVSVDFRPTIQVNEQKPGDANRLLSEADAVPGEAQPPQKAEAKSVIKDLDVLLLNAAGRSVTMDTAKNVNAIGKDLVNTGVISEKDLAKLESLAKDATDKLKALDKFSGREIAKALMVDKKSAYGDLVWGKGVFGLNATAKAVKAAVEAQEKLSVALAKFNDRLEGASEDSEHLDCGKSALRADRRGERGHGQRLLGDVVAEIRSNGLRRARVLVNYDLMSCHFRLPFFCFFVFEPFAGSWLVGLLVSWLLAYAGRPVVGPYRFAW